jgi:hypothetical protein
MTLGQAPAAKARTDYRANTKIKAAPITIRALAVIINGARGFGLDAGGIMVSGRYSL